MFIYSKIISTVGLLPPKTFSRKRFPARLLSLSLALLFYSCADPIKQIKFEDPPEITIDEDINAWYTEDNPTYSLEELQACRETKAQLIALGIRSLNRFKTLSEAQYIVKQRQRLKNNALDNSKPVTIALYPEYDYNGAFSWKHNTLGSIIAKTNQQVLFFEVRNDTECKAALRLLTDKLPVSQKLVLLLNGHGTQDALTWSLPRSVVTLDFDDYSDPEFVDLVRGLNIELVVFESCQTGLGSDNSSNLANRFAELIRVGGRVIAPLISIYKAAYVYDGAEKIIDVIYDNGTPGITYRVEGKYSLTM